MWVGLEAFGPILLDATLATTIFLSLVVLVMLHCHQPARRIVVAQAVILAAVLMMPLVAFSPLPRWNPITWYLRRDHVPQPFSAKRARPEQPDRPPVPFPGSEGTTEFLQTHLGRTSSGPLQILTLFYLLGVLIGLTWFLLGFWGIRRMVRESAEASSGTHELYRGLVREAGGKAPKPELRVSRRVHHPVLAGFFRSFIFLPPELDDPACDRESLRLILLHELAHADQGDSRFGAAASLAHSLWFFLPHVWWLRAQLRIDQEFVADQKTVLLAGTPAGYATRLVALAAPEGTAALSMRPIVASLPLLSGWWWDGGFKTPLLQRVAMLLHCPFPIETRAPRWWSLAMPPMVLVLALLTSCLSLFRSDSKLLCWGPPPSPKPMSRTFQVPQFVAAPQGVNSSGRAIPYVLPLALPSRFELSVEIQADSLTLSRIRLAGSPLGPLAPSAVTPVPNPGSAADSLAWHQVFLRRDDHGVTLRVDGRTIPVDPNSQITSQWFTIEPSPDQSAVLRNLVLTW